MDANQLFLTENYGLIRGHHLKISGYMKVHMNNSVMYGLCAPVWLYLIWNMLRDNFAFLELKKQKKNP